MRVIHKNKHAKLHPEPPTIPSPPKNPPSAGWEWILSQGPPLIKMTTPS